MSPEQASPGRGRFPGFDVLGQQRHWDPQTRGVVLARLAPPRPFRFFADGNAETAVALIGRLVDVDESLARTLCSAIDDRLADNETDGWHFDDMPTDHDAWTRSLQALDEESRERSGRSFAENGREDQEAALEEIRTGSPDQWHGINRGRLWDLWMRYACTAYWAHPAAWNEMGWPGPAYPRGYKNLGMDRREPFEVTDVQPTADPVRDDRP
jgi:hypothetical protein